MLRIGLTGGIGSGKSTVSALLAERGARIVDADVIAREAVAAGSPGLAAVVDAFGDGVLSADGSLDRPALAAVVFGDPAARATLDGIVHPLVRVRAVELITAMPEDAVVVQTSRSSSRPGRRPPSTSSSSWRPTWRYGWRGWCSGARRGRRAGADRRQATDEQRRAVADVVLDNSGTPEHLAEQVDRF